MRLDPNNEVDKIEKKLDRTFSAPTEEWDRDEAYIIRRERIEEIEALATKAYSDRCDAKLAEVGGAEKLMKIVDNGEWNSSDEMTEIEKEYWRLRNEEFLEDWEREHGKPYRMEDDPNAKF